MEDWKISVIKELLELVSLLCQGLIRDKTTLVEALRKLAYRLDSSTNLRKGHL